MTELRYQAGDMLFREGDPSTFAVRILSGELEVLREVDGQLLSLGIIGKGEWIGEMGVIEGRPRIGSARAVDNVTIEFVAKDDFLRRISQDQELAYELIVRLSERLTERVRESFGNEAASAPAEIPAPTREIVLQADSDRLQDEMSTDGMSISSFPFIVGRELGPREPAPAYLIDLTIEDRRPFRLSRQHFAIEETEDGILVRDMDSHLGTRVDGELLGTGFGRDVKALSPGEHLVVAGGMDSPYRFRITVPEEI